MRLVSLLTLLALAGCASAPPEAQPSAEVPFLVADAADHFARVRGVADTTQEYGFGDEISSETLYRAPLMADSAREAIVTVTTDPEGHVSSTYRALFGLRTSDLAFDQREERRRRDERNRTTRDALAQTAREALPDWTLDDDISSSPSLHECQGFLGRKVTITSLSDGARLVVHSGVAPCLSETDQALLLAAESGDTEALARALDAGASLSATGDGRYGSTALHIAAGSGHEDAVRLLLERGADPNTVSEEGLVPLMHATAEVARLLLDAGADANPEIGYGTGTPLSSAVISDDLEYVQLLLDAGADPDVRIPILSHQGALHFAVTNSSSEAVRLLLDAGADPDLADELGYTPLLSVVSGHDIGNPEFAIEIARMLIAAGADVNHASNDHNSYAWTPIMEAARNGEAEIVRFLLTVGDVDLSARNTENQTALAVARDEGYSDVVAVLEAAGAPE